MKWIVAGAGVLLSIAGLYGLITGASIVQVERGWASVIAGSVMLSGGLIMLAICALMARVEQLVVAWTGAVVSRGDLVAEEPVAASEPFRPIPPMFARPPAPELQEEAPPALLRDVDMPKVGMFPGLPPLRMPEPEVKAEIKPDPAPEPVSVEFESAPVIAGPAIEPVVEERPAALRDFQFVFPPLDEQLPEDKASEPVFATPAIHEDDRVEPLRPLDTKPAARFNLGWLRRNRDDAPAPPERIEPEAFIAPDPAPQVEPEPAPEVFAEPVAMIETVSVEIEQQVDEPRAGSAHELPVEPAKTPDPFSSDWLERALSGADEADETSARRFVPPSQRRTQAEAAQVLSGEALEETLLQAPAVQAPSAEAPVEIGRYRANDVAYIMFSDGSITAETANGTFRFNSLIELKDFIERGA